MGFILLIINEGMIRTNEQITKVPTLMPIQPSQSKLIGINDI